MQAETTPAKTAAQERVSDPRALAAARDWIGTPYVLGGAVRGEGCDCIGLVRGVLSDLTGDPPPKPPPWRADWANGGRLLVEAATRHLRPISRAEAGPGTVVVIRTGPGREAHCGILDEGDRIIHAVERRGVVSVPLADFTDRVSFAAAFPDT